MAGFPLAVMPPDLARSASTHHHPNSNLPPLTERYARAAWLTAGTVFAAIFIELAT